MSASDQTMQLCSIAVGAADLSEVTVDWDRPGPVVRFDSRNPEAGHGHLRRILVELVPTVENA